jgi:alkylation response protein AidB-like acyl-CoA dehydrogenase
MEEERAEAEAILRETARRVFKEFCSLTSLDGLERSESGHPPALWSQFVDLGWLDIVSGDDDDVWSLAMILEESGRAACASPFLATIGTQLMSRLIGANQDSPSSFREWGQTNHRSPAAVSSWDLDLAASATFEEAGWILSGGPVLSEWGGVAEALLIVGRPFHSDKSSAPMSADLCIALVRPDFPGVTIRGVQCLDNERAAYVELDHVLVPHESVARLGMAEFVTVRAVLATLRAADMIGSMEHMLEMAVTHTGSREQFGHPLSSFQVVQHKLADMRLGLDASRIAMLAALSSIGRPSFDYMAAVASIVVGRYAESIALEVAQLHGGMGYCRPHSLHYYFRRAKAQQLRIGRRSELLDRVANYRFAEVLG